jgi:hypothetical protein
VNLINRVFDTVVKKNKKRNAGRVIINNIDSESVSVFGCIIIYSRGMVEGWKFFLVLMEIFAVMNNNSESPLVIEKLFLEITGTHSRENGRRGQ